MDCGKPDSRDAGLTWMDCGLLLGSKSPRRRDLIARLGLPCRTVEIDVEETLTHTMDASEVAESLARKKCEAFSGRMEDNEVLVTADTVVVHGGTVMGKPHSRQEAVEMLRLLSGSVHQVYTGVALRGKGFSFSFSEKTDVLFSRLSDLEIDYYVDVYRPFDKAGAYGIQEWIGMIGIERIEGCYYNVMGLPVARLYKELKRLVNGDGSVVDQRP